MARLARQPLPSIDKPYVPGGKVPFAFRSLPGYLFCASRCDREVEAVERGTTTRWQEGWILITYYVEGDDEEHTMGGFAGPPNNI